MTKELVHEVLGIPLGQHEVTYGLDAEAISFILSELGIEGGKQPSMASIEDKLASMNSADETFL